MTPMKNLPRLILLAALLVLPFGCAKKDVSLLSAGTVVQNPALDSKLYGFIGDGPYATVKADALPAYYDSYRQELFDKGVTKWDVRFDCNHFASYYIAKAQLEYYSANFHSSTPAQTLALAEVWYKPAWAGGKQGHAIVAAFTDAGLLFIEPQTGQRIAMTAAERSSVYLVKW